MKGQHAAPRRGVTVPEIVLTGMAVPLALAAVLAVLALYAAFLLVRGIAGALVRVPAVLQWLDQLWAVTAVCWLLLLSCDIAAIAALARTRGHNGAGEALAVTTGLLALTVVQAARRLIQQRGQRGWRESGGRAFNPSPGTATEKVASLPDVNSARLDGQEERLKVLEAHDRQRAEVVSELARIVTRAFEEEQMPVPGALGPGADTKPMLRLMQGGQGTRGA